MIKEVDEKIKGKMKQCKRNKEELTGSENIIKDMNDGKKKNEFKKGIIRKKKKQKNEKIEKFCQRKEEEKRMGEN